MRKLINKLLEPKDNAPEAAFLLAHLLGAKISRSTLEEEIKNHPDYPGFLSVSDVFTNHKIDNLIARFDKDRLMDLPAPFITQISSDKNITEFTVVKEISKENVVFYDPETQNWGKTSVNEFTARVVTLVLLAEIEKPVVEKDFDKKVSEEKRLRISQNLMVACLPIFFVLMFILAFYQTGFAALLPVFYSALFLIGSLATVLLLWYEIDQTNTALQDICTTGKKVNCSAILQSKDAKIFGISWSTIGFVYFAGSSITLLISGISTLPFLIIMSWLTIVASPYILYSIYHQWMIAKQWCILCLSVQVVLALQCVVVLTAQWYTSTSVRNFDLLNSSIHFLSGFALAFIIVSLLIPALRKAKRSGDLAMELQRLKHSPDIFRAILEKQKVVEHSPEGLGIILGNPNGAAKIIKVCNPYCGPCAKAHTPIEELLHNNPELQVQIIFTAMNNERDVKFHPVSHLLAINRKRDPRLMAKALDDWYLADQKDYSAFAGKYPMNGELKTQGDNIEAMHEWCIKTEIKHTPTFFINGYQLPANYSVKDLKYFLSV